MSEPKMMRLYAADGSQWVPNSSVCRRHGALFVDGVLVAPWHAASAIEHGLRAIAGWAYSERRAFNEALAYWLDYPGPVYGAKLTEVVGLTGAALRRRGYQPVGTLAGAPVWTDPYLRGDQRVQLADGGYIISREAWAEASKKAVYPVSARTACYFCGRAVADGVCTVCGERQPTTEREDT